MDGKSASSALLGELRRSHGLTQRTLADQSGVPQPTIAEIESCRREPSITLLSKIAEGTGLTLELRLVPLDRFSAVATANAIAHRLFNPEYQTLSPGIRQDGALRAILDFRDNLRRSSAREFAKLVKAPPGLTGDTRWDAFVAAIVEDESARSGTAPPRWTNDPRRFVKPFWYLSEIPELHAWELGTAPAAFVRHGVLAAEEELASV